MIRINLLGETEDKTALYVLHVFAYCAVVFITIAACAVFQVDLAAQANELNNEKSKLTSELTTLKKLTKEIEDLQKKEEVLRQKLSTIATLKAKKHGPVHVLHDISKAVPEEAWVGEIVEKDGFIELYGAALDEHIVAKFMNQLEKSDYLESVQLISSELYLLEEVVGSKSASVRTLRGEQDSKFNVSKEVQRVVTKKENVTRTTKLKKFSLTMKMTDPLSLARKEELETKKES